MSKGLASVKTLTAREIAKKHNLPLTVIAKKIAAGVKVEKEHTTSTRQANEIARDHLGERPDYYDKLHKMEKSKVVKEEMGTDGVRGLGFVTGDPGVSAVDQYINTNALAYDPLNGARLDFMSKIHNKLHNKLGFNSYNPKDKVHFNKELVERKLNELGEYDNKGGTIGAEGLTDAAPLVHKRRSVKEQGYGIRSYTEKPLVEKNPNAYPTAADRGIYEDDAATIKDLDNKFFNKEPSVDEIGRRMKAADSGAYKDVADRLRSGTPKGVTDLRANSMYEEENLDEISAELVGKVSNARWRRGELPSKTLSRAINKKFVELGKKKETKMDNKERINEALDCILDDNLSEMKDNLMLALQEKAMEKLEERKKEIAANYFAE